MEEREEMERMINGIIDGVYVGTTEEIATKEIIEINNPEDREYEQLGGGESKEGGK